MSHDESTRMARAQQKAARANAVWYRLAKATRRLLQAHDGPLPDRVPLHAADLLEARTALDDALALLNGLGRG